MEIKPFKNNNELLNINKKRNLFKNIGEEEKFLFIIKTNLYNYFLNHSTRRRFSVDYYSNDKNIKYINNSFSLIVKNFNTHEKYKPLILFWILNFEKSLKFTLIKIIYNKRKIFNINKINKLTKYEQKIISNNLFKDNILNINYITSKMTFGTLSKIICSLNNIYIIKVFKALKISFLLYKNKEEEVSSENLNSFLVFIVKIRNKICHWDHLFKYGNRNPSLNKDLLNKLKFNFEKKNIFYNSLSFDDFSLILYLMCSLNYKNNKVFGIKNLFISKKHKNCIDKLNIRKIIRVLEKYNKNLNFNF